MDKNKNLVVCGCGGECLCAFESVLSPADHLDKSLKFS